MLFSIAAVFVCFMVCREATVAAANIPSSQLASLQSLYDSTNGIFWTWKKEIKNYTISSIPWNFSGSPNPCTEHWQGVTCTCGRRSCAVTELLLINNNMTGKLPASIGNLTGIKIINITVNQITGQLPSTFNSLRLLQYLDLHNNMMTGTLLPLLNASSFLISLDLSNNMFDGSIPDAIGNLSHLKNLDLSQNYISGTLPDTMSNLASLTSLYLNNNAFSGSIFKGVDQLVSLNSLDLSSNIFNGSIPNETFSLSRLQYFIVTNNRFSGTLSEAFGKLVSLEELYLGYNNFTGTIPRNISGIFALRSLILKNNKLSGSIPAAITSLTNLTSLDIAQNGLFGPLPLGLGYLKSLITFDFGHNNISGPLYEEIGEMRALTSITGAHNRLNGSLPSNIGQLSQLRTLEFTNNQISGIIPESIGDLILLRSLHLDFNCLSGGLPDSMSSMIKLKHVHLSNNFLNGTIPNEFSKLIDLDTFVAGFNLFSGSIPMDLASLRYLRDFQLPGNKLHGNLTLFAQTPQLLLHDLYLGQNSFTGILPSHFENWPLLTVFDVHENLLSGSIPESICSLSVLDNLQLNSNSFTGSIPNCLTSVTHLKYFDVYDNSMSGTILSNISRWEKIDYVDFGENSFTGTIPPILFNLSLLKYVYIDENFISGSIPVFENANELENVDLSSNILSGSIGGVFPPMTVIYSIHNNLLTGTIPSGIGKLPYLASMLLNSNMFSGTLESLFDANLQLVLQNIDVSSNRIHGQLPTPLFQLKSLVSFAAVSNCITGSIPDSICSASSLVSLALDGLHASPSCQNRFFPSDWQRINTYYLTEKLSGKIPACIFSLPNIQTFHLSGNGIGGNLQEIANITSGLQDLSLSHNSLTGTLPSIIMSRSWVNLSLSYNRFTGIIEKAIPTPARNASLILEVNRLSGVIPNNLINARNISILEGNIFFCSRNRSSLPSHDPDYFEYKCASDETDLSVFIWLGIAIPIILFVGIAILLYNHNFHCSRVQFQMVLKKLHGTVDNLRLWWSVYNVDHRLARFGYMEVYIFGQLMEFLRSTFLLVLAFILGILFPLYLSFSFHYSTYYFVYIWLISGALLSGLLPGIVLFIAFFFYLIYTISVMDRYMFVKSKELVHRLKSRIKKIVVVEELSVKRLYYLQLVGIVVVNVLVVVPVDSLYIFAVLEASPIVVGVAQMLLTMFKIIWNDAAVRFMFDMCRRQYISSTEIASDSLSDSYHWYHDRDTAERYAMVIVVLLNAIFVPCIVIMVISPDCFNNVFIAPAAVQSSYTFEKCVEYYFDIRGYHCFSSVPLTHTTTYTPPFVYSYQCSSFIVLNYSVIYVYTAVASGFFSPLSKLLIKYMYDRAAPDSYARKIIIRFMPLNLQPIDAAFPLFGKKLFDKEKFLMRINSNIAILMTFGTLFPPLGIFQLVSMILLTYYEQFAIARLLTEADKQHVVNYGKVVSQNCRNALQSLIQTIWLIMPTVCIFYAFFIFDIVGDSKGAYVAAIPALLMLLTPVVLFVSLKVMRLFKISDYVFYSVDMLLERDVDGDRNSIADTLKRGSQPSVHHFAVERRSVTTRNVIPIMSSSRKSHKQLMEASKNDTQPAVSAVLTHRNPLHSDEMANIDDGIEMT